MLHPRPCVAIPAFDGHKPARRVIFRVLAGVASKARAIPRADLERIVAGLSLTAGGVLGVLIAGWLS